MKITKEIYQEAQRIVDNYQKCDWCNQIFKIEEIKDTWDHGYHKYWCKPCYEGIKDD